MPSEQSAEASAPYLIIEPVIRMSPDKIKIFPNFTWADRKITVFAM